jgi:uncharacterized protein (DUF2062 family)
MKLHVSRAFQRRKLHPLTWKRRRKVLVLDLLGREESPERVAAAIALGIGIGFSPFIGFHIWIALGLAFLFRLNKIDAALGQFAGNPWTLPAVYAFGYRLGRRLLAYDRRSVPSLPWDRLLHRDFWRAFKGPAFAPRLLSFLVGTTVIAIFIGLVAYGLFLAVLRIYHRRHPRVAIRAARRRTTEKLRLRRVSPDDRPQA